MRSLTSSTAPMPDTHLYTTGLPVNVDTFCDVFLANSWSGNLGGFMPTVAVVETAEDMFQEATSNKCIASSNKCLTTRNKKLLGVMTESAVALGSITEREGGGGGGQADDGKR